jgi:hypothetical protein
MGVTASFELRVVGRGLSFHDCIACSGDSLSCNISRKCISYGRSVYYHEYFLNFFPNVKSLSEISK